MTRSGKLSNTTKYRLGHSLHHKLYRDFAQAFYLKPITQSTGRCGEISSSNVFKISTVRNRRCLCLGLLQLRSCSTVHATPLSSGSPAHRETGCTVTIIITPLELWYSACQAVVRRGNLQIVVTQAEWFRPLQAAIALPLQLVITGAFGTEQDGCRSSSSIGTRPSLMDRDHGVLDPPSIPFEPIPQFLPAFPCSHVRSVQIGGAGLGAHSC